MLPYNIFLLVLIYFTGISLGGNTRQRTTPIPLSSNDFSSSSSSKINSPIEIVSFDQLLFEMDSTEQCNKTLSGPLIQQLINDSFKNGQYDKNIEYILESISTADIIERKNFFFTYKNSKR